MSEWKWIDTLTRQFELCDVSAGRDVIVVAETTTPHELVDTALIALQRNGAQGSIVVLPSRGSREDLTLPKSIATALSAAGLIIDCTANGLSAPTDTDMLILGSTSPKGLDRFVPHPGLKERVAATVALIEEAEEMRVTSGGGTDVTIELDDGDDRMVTGSWGCPHAGARAVAWPGGFVRTTPHAERAAGTIVVMPADVNVTMRKLIHSPVTLKMEQGRICDIVGDSGDADLIRAYLEAFDAADAYLLREVTIGLNPTFVSPRPFDPDEFLLERAPLHAGQFSFGIGIEDDADSGSAPLLVIGLRTATVDVGSVCAVNAGLLVGDLAPDIYEVAASAT